MQSVFWTKKNESSNHKDALSFGLNWSPIPLRETVMDPEIDRVMEPIPDPVLALAFEVCTFEVCTWVLCFGVCGLAFGLKEEERIEERADEEELNGDSKEEVEEEEEEEEEEKRSKGMRAATAWASRWCLGVLFGCLSVAFRLFDTASENL